MIAMTGLIKTVDDSYISLIITSKLGSKMRISDGEMKIILKEPRVPMMLLPLINSSVLNETIAKWQAINIDKEIREKPFRTQSSYWNIKDQSFSPKEAGIYYISASFQAALLNTTVTPKRAFEAKVFLKRNNNKKGKEMMYGIQNLREEPRTLSLAGAVNLDSNDKLFLMFRCQDCKLSASSGISAVLLSKSFNMEGFSTKLSASQNKSVKESVHIDRWSWHFADFYLTNSFNADTGVYEAPHTGVYLIICTLIVQNIQKQGTVNLRIDITNSTASYIEESLPVSGDGPESMTLTVPVKLNQGQAVALVLSAINSQNITVINGSKFSITSLMHGSSTLPPGFTLSLRNIMAFSFRWSSPLKDWSQDAIAGAFSKKSEALFEFNERQGEMIIRKEAVLLLNIIAHVNVDRGSQLTLNVRINEEIVERVLSVTSYVDSVEYLKISAALFVKNKDRITVEVQCLNRRSTYYVLRKTMMSAVFLSSTSTKPGLTLGVRKSLVGQVNGKKTFRYILKNDCSGCYQDNIPYNESQGYFQIPLGGRYLISVNFELQTASLMDVVECGFLSVEQGQSILSESFKGSGLYQISGIALIDKATKITFMCTPENDIQFLGLTFMTITLLQYWKGIITSVVKKAAVIDNIKLEVEYKTLKNRPYIVVVSNINSTLNNFRLTKRKDDDQKNFDVIVDYRGTVTPENKPVFAVVYLGSNERLVLECEDSANNFDANMTTLYEIPSLNAGITLTLVENLVMKPSNRTSRVLVGWERILNFKNELKFDFQHGLLISKLPAEYLFVVNFRFVAQRKGKRSLFLSVTDELEKHSFSVPLCDNQNGKTCGTSFITSLKLQKWQTVGLYLTLTDVNDSVTVLSGTRMSIVMLEKTAALAYDDRGPSFIEQPWPVYTNHSSIFEYQCAAIGSQSITKYTWNWISRETKLKKVVGYGKSFKVLGRPEESGYYFCTANMNGTVRNSRISTLDISDTDECKQNATEELKMLCHTDAYCINTIGSYLCRCNNGFNGDGFRYCKDVDECSLNGTCHANATCTNSIGSFSCRCNTGFRGNGTMCSDINECLESNECSKDADCINTVGSYRCDCKEGFDGDGYGCENINECNYEKNPCDDAATCSDTYGSFKCQCREGWTGNGTVCEDINECLFTNCTGNATCYNQPGSYRCKCNPGYKGDGFDYCEPLGCTPPPECTGEFKAAWWARSPYLANSSNQEPFGLFKDLLTQVVIACCANCSLLSFDGPYNGSSDVEAVIEVNKTVDFGCPLYGSPDQTLFKGLPFMPIVESPGIAFFIKDKPKEKSALLDSLGSTWPILAITFLLACLSGVIIWFLDTVRNPVEFPNSFIEGSWEGFWWAFITMTTVGYGDKAPRSFPARLFGIVWILVGLVIISTFTATITTMLTASSLSDETKLYGTKVGVLENSEEYRLGVKRNAETKAYNSVEEIVSKVEEGEVQGILLDTYIAGEFQEQLKSLRLQQVIDYSFSYGVVLSRDGLALRKCFSHYLESKQSQIYATISKVIKPLKTRGNSNLASKKSANIFDADSVYFKYIVFIGLGTFVLLFLVGLTCECVNARKRKYQMAPNSATDKKEPELMEWRVQWESGKVSYFQRNIFKNDISDLKQQIKEFADNWIRQLEELESRQAKEVANIRMNDSKLHNGNTRSRPALERIFSAFKSQKKSGNGHLPESSTSL
ncbi:uncharacterized protein LOC135682248 [Rhopilema esculentum]|uniref:uncharacterized protein LOC135682248 n=1 Tax=Rhopilema esculentum TaxID=499914 RepID=UPI0031E445E9